VDLTKSPMKQQIEQK